MKRIEVLNALVSHSDYVTTQKLTATLLGVEPASVTSKMSEFNAVASHLQELAKEGAIERNEVKRGPERGVYYRAHGQAIKAASEAPAETPTETEQVLEALKDVVPVKAPKASKAKGSKNEPVKADSKDKAPKRNAKDSNDKAPSKDSKEAKKDKAKKAGNVHDSHNPFNFDEASGNYGNIVPHALERKLFDAKPIQRTRELMPERADYMCEFSGYVITEDYEKDGLIPDGFFQCPCCQAARTARKRKGNKLIYSDHMTATRTRSVPALYVFEKQKGAKGLKGTWKLVTSENFN